MQSAMVSSELDKVVATHSSKAQDTAEQAGVWQLDPGSCKQLSDHAAQPCPAHLSVTFLVKPDAEHTNPAVHTLAQT